jgi:phenylacetate-CoA ligase
MPFFDSLETRSPEQRDADFATALPKQVANAKSNATAYHRMLAGVDPEDITSREALAQLPVTRKGQLVALQADHPPFGGLEASPVSAARLFQSPGPIYEFSVAGEDFWRIGRALFAAGFRAGDIVHNSFAYHLTPGGWMLDNAARALGCAVIPAGTGNSEQQAQAIDHYRPQAYTGTPDFLKVLLDKGEALGLDCSSITKALVSGGALFPQMRHDYADRGVSVLQCYATADLGLIAYESEAPDGFAREGMILDEGVIVEILRPGSDEVLPEGEVGEVVVTSLTPAYPLLRFATGDLSAIMPGQSPCGRTNRRIKGWMGRADQTAKVKGMFVRPEQVAAVVKRHPEIQRARLTVTRAEDRDVMLLSCEAATDDAALAHSIAESLADICKLRGRVELTRPGSLPNDGKVIDDQRSYD